MKYYYGDTFEDLIKNTPARIHSELILKAYRDAYRIVVSEEDLMKCFEAFRQNENNIK